jgi:hypothetical protein
MPSTITRHVPRKSTSTTDRATLLAPASTPGAPLQLRHSGHTHSQPLGLKANPELSSEAVHFTVTPAVAGGRRPHHHFRGSRAEQVQEGLRTYGLRLIAQELDEPIRNMFTVSSMTSR